MLANIFVGFHESFLFERRHKPHVYLRYVDDTFSVFDSIEDAAAFRLQLNFLHSSLQFTMEVECDRALDKKLQLISAFFSRRI